MTALPPTMPLRDKQMQLHAEACDPEPTQLYGLLVLAFLRHQPAECSPACRTCGQVWPCDHVRHAYRLREGF